MDVDVIRGLYACFATGDVPGVLGTFDPEISWTEAAGFPYAGTYVGGNAILANVFARLGSEWHGFKAVPHTFVTEGEMVITLGDYSGTYKATGKSFSAPFAHVWTLSGGKIVRFHQHTDTVLVQAALN